MLKHHLHCLTLILLALAGGCSGLRPGPGSVNRVTLKHRAIAVLEAAAQYPHNPAVRVGAVEALSSGEDREGLSLIRAALLDEHPAVRFAACVAVGRLRDTVSTASVSKRPNDENASVQVAALFALHQLGDHTKSGRIPTYLLEHDDVTVRRNAAMILGLLGEKTAVKVLARAMRDADEGVRHHALEAMARLGNREARQELAFMVNAGIGSTEVFAIDALARTGDATYLDTFRYKLATSTPLEVRLAAAKGLATLGSSEGLDVARRALRTRRELIQDANDPAPGQILRARLMAAAALGAIGRTEALPAMARLMGDEQDPRVQVAGARAVLDILAADRRRALPFAPRNSR